MAPLTKLLDERIAAEPDLHNARASSAYGRPWATGGDVLRGVLTDGARQFPDIIVG